MNQTKFLQSVVNEFHACAFRLFSNGNMSTNKIDHILLICFLFFSRS